VSIETWRARYAHLLEEMPLNHHYQDEAQPGDYKRLKREISKDDFELDGLFSRPQIQRNEAPKTVSRTVPAWFFNDAAVQHFLTIQFPKFHHTLSPHTDCKCPECRDLRGMLLWAYIIRRLRMNEPAEEIARDWAPQPKRKKKVAAITPDPNDKDWEKPEYWEKVLKSHDLADKDCNPEGYRPQDERARPYECPGQKPITASYVRRILQQIRFVAAGLRTDGKVRAAKKGVL
jgi:hypothetical protein